MLKVIIGILILVLLNLKELITSPSKGKVMGVYFVIVGISLILGILLSIKKAPPSPYEIIMVIFNNMGLGDE
ncbi:hypothetical protein [Ruminiclostridium papyrosolvens]|uniref:Uncharacterized protein n=1 Tax=Ruminiclostridium papyrosolvens C7 TaxID=1330534 RepID=U4QYI4_9FIRM|nr:hypothetical protein [Ruminiclostridium papyrosolvens]EPR08301.1 hypothetical protein L323_18120 [Ruminiclostridium papyrosolvens C7]